MNTFSIMFIAWLSLAAFNNWIVGKYIDIQRKIDDEGGPYSGNLWTTIAHVMMFLFAPILFVALIIDIIRGSKPKQ